MVWSVSVTTIWGSMAPAVTSVSDWTMAARTAEYGPMSGPGDCVSKLVISV